MIQPEAEEAAARRNREDSRRDRFVFYALDESAGIAPDAWEVAMRLRRDDERPRRKSRARPASIPPPAPREPQETATAVIEPDVEAPAPVAWESLDPTEVYDLAAEPMVPLEPAPDAPDAGPEAEPVRRRRFGLVRLWGVFVVLVGLAFIAAVLIVAFTFEDYTHLNTLTWGTGVAIGVFAVGVGLALARRRR